MRGPLPASVDPWRAAATGQVLVGTVDPRRTPRLAALAPPRGPLAVHARFAHDAGGGATLELEVQGEYTVTCQRCLEPFVLVRDDRSALRLVADEEAAREAEGESEELVCPLGESVDLAALVEDEVLLALPFAPRHPPEACVHRVPPPPEEPAATVPARENPFAALASLRGGRDEET